jgi:hypothetical protein
MVLSCCSLCRQHLILFGCCGGHGRLALFICILLHCVFKLASSVKCMRSEARQSVQ